MASKCILNSRTVWFNALVAAFAVFETGSGALRGVLGETGYLLLMMGIAAANVLLRSITSQPVTLRKGEP